MQSLLYKIMRIFILCVLCVVLVAPSSCHLIGSLESHTPQTILVLNDYSLCFTRTRQLSLKQMLTHGFLCVKNNLLHCILKRPIDYSRGLTEDVFLPLLNSAYCGSIWMREKPIASFTKYIVLQVTTAHNIHLNIVKFHFFLTNPISCYQHGMILSYPNFESENFCGKRIPWSLITNGNTLILLLTVREYKAYDLQLYYSSFLTSWISDISSVSKVYKDDFSYFYITRPHLISPYSTLNIPSYEYYVMTHPDNYFIIDVISKTNPKGDLIIRDGPGPLSPIISESKYLQITDLQIETSAFWAYIHINFFDHSINSDLSLQFTTAYNLRDIPLCKNQDTNIIIARSNIMKNTVCMDTFHNTQRYITLNVETFLFSGPNMVTDLSDSVCQYGGFLLQFNDRIKEFEFCESLNDYAIYTGNYSINFILVWFAEYSHGNFIGFLGESECVSYYPEIDMIPSGPMSTYGCAIFVSPALVSENQSLFNIRFGPPALGSAAITIKHLNTLSSCEPEYIHMEYEKDFQLSVETVSLYNWPLDIGNIANNTKMSFSRTVEKSFFFNYLYSANISISSGCIPALTRKQLAVIIQRSACVLMPSKIIKHLVMNKIPSLVGFCGYVTYDFTPTGMMTTSYMSFIYHDRGYVYNGHLIHVKYNKCPNECRKYRYRTFVRSEDENTVLEYTAHVGQATSTGPHHRGFKVAILTPDKLCHQHMLCELTLYMDKLTPKDNKSDPNLHFHDKR